MAPRSLPLTEAQIQAAEERLEAETPETTLQWALDTFGERVSLASSFGAEDMCLIDMLCRLTTAPRVFYLDTGLLFRETYALIRAVKDRYPIRLERVTPLLTVEEQAETLGPALWMRDPDRCCHLRKVEPLTGYLAGEAAWITGIRRDQTPTRARARVVEADLAFGVVKINPLLRWTTADVFAYLKDHDVPYNPLHDRGYPSIGCWPCTRPVAPGEDPRSGRWAGTAKTECGLHLAPQHEAVTPSTVATNEAKENGLGSKA
jgi:phosphoadenosine phosphosulfate reductase